MFRITCWGLAILLLSIPSAHSQERLPGTWANWRGPMQNGTSEETGLPSSWSPKGENLLWKVPLGGRSAPIFLADRLYMIRSTGEGATQQEEVLCLDAESGRSLWSYRYNVYSSDVPPHRIGWASPVGDPESGRIYTLGVSGVLHCFDREGRVLWRHSLLEEFGVITTHGGRTNTPVVFENLLIASGVTSGWGSQGRGAQRYMAFDKITGEPVWVKQPGGNPYDTTYTSPLIATFQGQTLLIDQGSDGAVFAMQARTGEKVWRFEFSKRGLNTCIVTDGSRIYATHGEENTDTAVMGRIVALEPTGSGELTKAAEKWRVDGLTVGYSSPALHGGRLYAIDNGANLFCIDTADGRQLWKLTLGTIQKASPVFADGKIYVGTVNGKFYILEPGDSACKVLDSDELSEIAGEEEIVASVAVARGRVYLVTTKNTYCIGSKHPAPLSKAASGPRPASHPAGPAAYVQVRPADVLAAPGETVDFRARTFDAQGVFLREESAAAWSLSGVQGTLSPQGKFASGEGPQAGEVRATVGGIVGAARVRVIPRMPFQEDFEAMTPGSPPGYWVGAPGKFQVREVEGNKVLVKLANPQAMLYRGHTYFGPPDLSDYTIEADILAIEKRRQMPDIGVMAQHYAIVLAGNSQKLWIESWQPQTNRTKTIDFSWKPNVWYRMKLRADNLPDGQTLVRGKVWPKGEAEPEQWTITQQDALPNRNGSPGLYFYAPNEIYIDNIQVRENLK